MGSLSRSLSTRLMDYERALIVCGSLPVMSRQDRCLEATRFKEETEFSRKKILGD